MATSPKTNEDSHIWSYTSKQSCFLVVFGLPFLVVGLQGVFAPLFALFSSEIGDVSPFFLVTFLSIPFLAFGVWAIWGGNGMEINGHEGTAVTWWGLRVPFSGRPFSIRRKVHPLRSFRRVALRREVRQPDRGSPYSVYAIRLIGKSEELHIIDVSESDPGDARLEAEKLARVCKRDLEDHTGGSAVVRSYDKLDESLRDRMKRAGDDLPQQRSWKEDWKSNIQRNEDEVVIEMASPVSGINSSRVWILLVMIGFFVSPFGDEFEGLLVVFAGATVGSIAIAVLPRLLGLTEQVRVIATPDQLAVNHRGLMRTRCEVIPAHDLEELVLPEPEKLHGLGDVPKPFHNWVRRMLGPDCQITAHSDETTVTFGRGLTYEELKSIHVELVRVLAK